MKVSTIKANYSRVVATVGLRRLSGHYSSLLFAPLFLVSCLALLAPCLLSQVLTPCLLALISLLVLVYKLWFRSTQVMLPSHVKYPNYPERTRLSMVNPSFLRCRGAPWPPTILTSAWPPVC